MPNFKLLAAAAVMTSVMLTGCGEDDAAVSQNVPKPDVQGARLDGTPEAPAKPTPASEPAEPAEPTKPAVTETPAAPAEASKPAAPDSPAPEPVADSGLAGVSAAEAARMAAGQGTAGVDPEKKPATAAEASADALEAHKQRIAQQPPPKELPGYEPVRFDRLAGYIYISDPPDAGPQTDADGKPRPVGDAQIPPEVKALDGKKVTVRGMMVPIDFHKFQTNEFILVQALPDCYFCQQPMVNEWIEVKTLDKSRVDYAGDEPITVAGTLRVGAVYSGRYLESLYRIELDKIVE